MFVPVSTAVAEGNRLVELGLPNEVVPNFVPDDVAERRDGGPSLANIPPGPFWLYVGALSRNKGVHVLLDAYERLQSPPPLVLIGMPWSDTPTRFPPNTYVLKGLPHPAVMAAWGRAELGIVPSVFPDPCPTVAVEAMAAGVPLIASRVGGLPDLVAHGETGLLVEPSDSTALAGALATLHGDPALAQRMREAAHIKARSFMASTVVARLETIYQRVGRPS
jgi:glycosyltransferase involved in cell wall biosynthesis